MSFGGYVPKRRGVLDHLRDGRLTLQQFGAFDALVLLADKASGIWNGSARALAAQCGAGDVSDRQARHLLESIEAGRYIKRFPTPRSHRNYPILIDKFLITFGAHRGKRLNASATSDWRNPVYESCLEDGAERGAEQGPERAPNQEVDLRPRIETMIIPHAQKTRRAQMTGPYLPCYENFKDQFPNITAAQFKFAVERILARAKTPPCTLSFWETSLPIFFSNLEAETDVFLTDLAREQLAEGKTLADVSAILKEAAAARELPYDHHVVDKALTQANSSLVRDAEIQAQVQLG